MEIRNIRLDKKSRRRLCKIPHMGGTVADAIEDGTWHVAIDTYDFDLVRRRLSNVFMEFFSLNEPDRPLIVDYDAGIISYGGGH